jgi:hypothetical protein
VDAEGNALVVVTDCRNSQGGDISYTLYKVSPTGEMLWGENGLDLGGGNAFEIVANMKIVQLENGTYFCAWGVYQGNDIYIQMQRISQTGELLWNETSARIYENATMIEYPYLAKAGDNNVIVVFSRGTGMFNKNIRARKIDVNGTKVWANDVIAYNSGFGFTPMWVVVSVIPDQMGGAFVGWFDDRNNTWIESTYVSHITTNGTHGFASGDNGEKVGHSSLRSFNPEMYFDATDGFLYVTWREANENEAWQKLKAQKMKIPSGELMWGNDGIDVSPYTQKHSLSFYSIQKGEDNNVAVFFTSNTWHPEHFYGWEINNVTLIDSHGEYVWKEEIIQFSNPVGFKGRLVSTPLIADNYWLTAWNDERKIEGDPEGSKKIYMQRINIDGTLGGGEIITCETPVSLNVTEITHTSATLSWEEGNEANLTWELRYSEAAQVSWIYVDVLEDKTYFLEGLTQNTAYLWSVRAHCIGDLTSEWATQNNFSTQEWSVNEFNKKLMTVFASGKILNIINPENRYIENVQLFDINGRLLFDFTIKSTDNVLLPTNLNSAMVLFVKIIGKNEVENHKIIMY